MYQGLAELGDVFRNRSESLIGTELDHEYLPGLGRIIPVGLDKMLKLHPTPARLRVVLREENQQSCALLDFSAQIITEWVARFELVIDEQIFLDSPGTGVEVVCERGDPAVLGHGPGRAFVIVMGVADEYVVLESWDDSHSFLSCYWPNRIRKKRPAVRR